MAEQLTPLMPHATASWLVDNTGLSFDQIAEFCGLHILEVNAMADDLASSKYTGRDPVQAQELTHEEIEKAEKDGLWLILGGHEIGSKNRQTTEVKMLKKLLPYLNDPGNGIWVAPVGEISTYIKSARAF